MSLGKNGIDNHQISLGSLRVATNNFSDLNKLGQGGFGPVYKVYRIQVYARFIPSFLNIYHRKVHTDLFFFHVRGNLEMAKRLQSRGSQLALNKAQRNS